MALHLFFFLFYLHQGEIDYGFASAKWNPVGLPDGEYELMVHVICEASGLSFPPPGIDDYFSSSIRGVWLRYDSDTI